MRQHPGDPKTITEKLARVVLGPHREPILASGFESKILKLEEERRN